MHVEVTPCIILFNIFFQAPERRSQTLEVQVDPRARSFAGSSRQNSVPLDQDKASPPMARSKGMSPMAGRVKGKLESRSFSGSVLSSLDRDGLPNQVTALSRLLVRGLVCKIKPGLLARHLLVVFVMPTDGVFQS